MIYKAFKNWNLSLLGMGNMRLPTKGEGMTAPIDQEKAQEIIDYAMSHGINYFDTAYVYHGGKSEQFVGDALSKYPREAYHLATKFFVMANPDYKAVFEEQLSRCKTDYFDFYLLHAIGMNPPERYLDAKYGVMDFMLEQKRAGRIRNLGFSFHGTIEQLEQCLKAYDWDFVQIQLNYLDWSFYEAKRQYEILAEHNIPVIVMEPVRGGRLASLSPSADAMLEAAQPGRSVASWAFRWLMRLPNVKVILSGMSTLDQIADNVKTFEKDDPLTDEQTEILNKACALFHSEISVPCTSCRYCCDDCPQEIEIPKLMEIYNDFKLSGPMGLMGMERLEKKASDCIACGACTAHCPQSIAIPELMQELAEAAAHQPGRPFGPDDDDHD
jgi:predicted aldo/keto reductase-like oxidoreductase